MPECRSAPPFGSTPATAWALFLRRAGAPPDSRQFLAKFDAGAQRLVVSRVGIRQHPTAFAEARLRLQPEPLAHAAPKTKLLATTEVPRPRQLLLASDFG